MRLTRTLFACAVLSSNGTHAVANEAPRADIAPAIDGNADDNAWQRAKWQDLNFLMAGSLPNSDDFSARYKVVWTPEHLYLLAEITDDVLLDSHPDPLQFYWDDDALEIFIDEDASGGLHRHDYNAFAYHLALDNQAVDIGPFRSEEDRAAGIQNTRTFPEHVTAVWRRSLDSPHRIVWEVRISVFGDDYKERYAAGAEPATPVTLHAGKKLGFMVAYCDADSAAGREHFMGDTAIEAVDGDRNLGYIDAGVFGTLSLTE